MENTVEIMEASVEEVTPVTAEQTSPANISLEEENDAEEMSGDEDEAEMPEESEEAEELMTEEEAENEAGEEE